MNAKKSFAGYLVLIIALAGLYPLPQLHAQKTPARPSKSGGKSQPAKPEPLNFPQLLELLEAAQDLKIDPADRVSKFSVSFQASPDMIAVLKQYGASERLLRLIPKTPPPPPPPASPVAGTLTVTCQPVDCFVVANDRFFGKTASGAKEIAGLPPGDVSLTVFADGFPNLNQEIVLSQNQPASRAFALSPTPDQRRDIFRKELLATIAELGGVDGIYSAQLQSAKGTVELKGDGLQAGTWPVDVNTIGAAFSMGEPKTACRVLFLIEPTKADCKGRKRDNLEKEATASSRLFRGAMISRILGYFTQDSASGDAASREEITVQSDNATTFTKDGPDGIYRLTVGANHLPLTFEESARDASAPRQQIKFENFAKANGGFYPSEFSVTRGKEVTAQFKLASAGLASSK